MYARIDQFSVFRWGFFAYLLIPTLVLLLEAGVAAGWEHVWVGAFLEHLLFLLVNVHVSATLAPSSMRQLARPFRQQPSR